MEKTTLGIIVAGLIILSTIGYSIFFLNKGTEQTIPTTTTTTTTTYPTPSTTPTIQPEVTITYIPTTFSQSTKHSPPPYYIPPNKDTKPSVGLMFTMNNNIMLILSKTQSGDYSVTDYNTYINIIKTDQNYVSIPIQYMTEKEIISYF